MRRRDFIASAALLSSKAMAQDDPTRFQLACMTLPYSAFSFERALTGIECGYSYVSWGVNHRQDAGAVKPVIALDAPPTEAARLASHCQNVGLQPVMMFSTVNFEDATALDAHRRRIDQAQSDKIPFLLTFGKTTAGEYDSVIRNLKGVAGHAKAAGVTVVIKQHGGNTATGKIAPELLLMSQRTP